MKSPDLSPLWKDLHELWSNVDQLFGEHHFITILCAFFAVMMTISFYRLLKSISPALVAFILLLITSVLVMHWTITRTEPAFLTPAIDFIAPFFPSAPEYPTGTKTKPAKPAPKKPKTAAVSGRGDDYFRADAMRAFASVSSASNSGAPWSLSNQGSSGSV